MTPASRRWPIWRHVVASRRNRSSDFAHRPHEARIAGLAHIGALAYGKFYAAMFELMRGDHSRAAPNALELARLARDHELPLCRASAFFSRAGRR